jgi:acyl-coenzyme A synthetase/AMP-(fatty) acid ligase
MSGDPEGGGGVVGLDPGHPRRRLWGVVEDVETGVVRPENAACVVFTSGTTGRPNAV